MELGAVHDNGGNRSILLVHIGQIVAVGVVQRLLAHYSGRLHLLVAAQRGGIHRQIRRPSRNFILLDVCIGGPDIRLGCLQSGMCGFHLSENLHPIQLGQHLAFVHPGICIHIPLLDDAAGLRLYLDLCDGLHLTCGHDALGDVHAADRGDAAAVDLCAAAVGHHGGNQNYQGDQRTD